MESSLHGVWESAVGNPFIPTIGKESQFVVGFSLLCLGVLLSGLFGLSMIVQSYHQTCANKSPLDRSALTLPLLGLPASAAIAYVVFKFHPSFLVTNIKQGWLSLYDLRGRSLCLRYPSINETNILRCRVFCTIITGPYKKQRN